MKDLVVCTTLFVVFQGMLVVDSEIAKTPKTLLNLWKNECNRVISDRFITHVDKEWFEKAIKTIVDEDLGHELSSLVDPEPFFVDFLRDAPEATGRVPYAYASPMLLMLMLMLIFRSLFVFILCLC